MTFAHFDLIPAQTFSIEELTDIYNQTRLDYIVPMPMNPNKMLEYINTYDIDLAASAVAVDGNEILGLAMLGVRENQAWISRLGVVRVNRRNGAGTGMVDHLIDQAKQLGLESIVIEVIKDNVPAFSLFTKKGFHKTRDLLVLRRPPSPSPRPPANFEFKLHRDETVLELLRQRTSIPSWLDAYESLMNTGNLAALWVQTDGGGQGWLAYQKTAFQLGRLVIQTEAGDPLKVSQALLCQLHTIHPRHDTKTENLPADDPHWPTFEAMNYLISFERDEMVLQLS